MNEKKVLQLKISCLIHKISKLPRGWIGTFRGMDSVVIYYDPKNPKVSNRSRRRYTLTSKWGTAYKEGITRRKIAEAELEKLNAEWASNYRGAPEIIEFPLRRTRFLGILPKHFFEAKPNQNKYEIKNPIYYKDQILRSKNELLAVQTVESMGFMWKAEIEFRFGKYLFYPDVVFYVDYIDKVIALELDGMMEKDEYYEHAEERRAKYIKAGFVENKDVIFFRISNENDFNLEDLKAMIKSAIERNAADIFEREDFYV